MNENIEAYIEIVLENCEGEIVDSEKAILTLLNNDSITIALKEAYIKQLTTTIKSLSEIGEKDLWGTLLSNEVAILSVENIIEYFGDASTFDDILIQFINESSVPLDFSNVKQQYGEEIAQEFFGATIVCQKLSDKKYKEILSTFSYHYNEFAISNLSDEKFKILVDLKIARMTPKSLIFTREHYSSCCLHFIKSNVSKYADLMTQELFDPNELTAILGWDIADNLKLKLLEFMKEPISVIGLKCSFEVLAYILNNNHEKEDNPELFSSYSKWSDNLRQIIESLAVGELSKIIANPENVSIELLKKFFATSSLNSEQKINLLVSTLSMFDQNECEEIFDMLRLPSKYKDIYDKSKRPSFEVDETSQKLLPAFVEAGLIHSFEEDQSRDGYFKIRRTRPSATSLPPELL